MARETDEKLHNDLIDQGYKQSSTDDNRYWKSKEGGGYQEIDTDDKWYKPADDSEWKKH